MLKRKKITASDVLNEFIQVQGKIMALKEVYKDAGKDVQNELRIAEGAGFQLITALDLIMEYTKNEPDSR